ncbi:conserved hypothetical protein [Vibrio chagasii]|nr:conserved hypothetical protein [Vibrio chagasii]CAH7423857.1 conserved hypothetical protein [Vibrio chagasii]CAH7455313.1 conserved hypothetical protein [Vibrio chagasii]
MSYIIILIIASVLGYLVAKSKNKSGGMWATLCFMLPILLLVLLVLPKDESDLDMLKADGLKEAYINKYVSNEDLFRKNAFLGGVFTQLAAGKPVPLKELNEAFNTMALMEINQ